MLLGYLVSIWRIPIRRPPVPTRSSRWGWFVFWFPTRGYGAMILDHRGYTQIICYHWIISRRKSLRPTYRGCNINNGSKNLGVAGGSGTGWFTGGWTINSGSITRGGWFANWLCGRSNGGPISESSETTDILSSSSATVTWPSVSSRTTATGVKVSLCLAGGTWFIGSSKLRWRTLVRPCRFPVSLCRQESLGSVCPGQQILPPPTGLLFCACHAHPRFSLARDPLPPHKYHVPSWCSFGCYAAATSLC